MKKYKKAYLEITNICNLNCDFCPKTKRKKQFMDENNFETAIYQISQLTDYVYFHLMGEPTLHPKLREFLEIAQKYNLKVIITTNWTLINEVSDVLSNAKSLYKIVFSLHSFEANDDKFPLENYLKNIIEFSKKARKDKICVLRLLNPDN